MGALLVVIRPWKATADDAASGVTATFDYSDGFEGALSDFAGKPLVVNFWASWCPACVAEMLDFEASTPVWEMKWPSSGSTCRVRAMTPAAAAAAPVHARLRVVTDFPDVAGDQHFAWLARSFGRPDYLPLTAADLEVLSGVAEPVKRFRGSHLFRQGEPAVAAYLLREGEVDIYRNHSGSARVVARVGPGSVIGDIAMFGEGVYKSSVRAVGHVRAYRFDRETLIPELAKHPAICLRWLVSGLNQLERTQRRIIQLMHKTVLAQVADLLAEEASIRPDVSLSQASIATLLGVSRQSVNEALGELRGKGLVETGYRMIRVLDVDGLRALASEYGT